MFLTFSIANCTESESPENVHQTPHIQPIDVQNNKKYGHFLDNQ